MKYLTFNILLIILLFISASPQPFSFSQEFNEPSSSFGTYKIDLSDDSNILVSGFDDNNTYIYQRTSNTFSHNQTIKDSQSRVRGIDITGDGQFLLVVEKLAYVRIYKNKNNQFIE